MSSWQSFSARFSARFRININQLYENHLGLIGLIQIALTFGGFWFIM